MKKCLRLTKNLEFKKVYRAGRRWSSFFFNMYIKKNNLEHPRLGVSVSKKVGKSVVRNKTKRRIKEAFRQNLDFVKSGYDIVISAKPPASETDFSKIEKEIIKLLKRGHVWHDKKDFSGNN